MNLQLEPIGPPTFELRFFVPNSQYPASRKLRMTRVYVALDLEMTGLHSERDAILEIGAARFRDDQILDTWSSLVNPNRPLPHKIERLTGITQAEVERAPSFHSLLPALSR